MLPAWSDSIPGIPVAVIPSKHVALVSDSELRVTKEKGESDEDKEESYGGDWALRGGLATT
jgi:hypothetical protein